MSVAEITPPRVETDHALLVPLGRFGRSIGLPDAFAQVPITMKTVEHSPADKLTELFVHILAGGMHIKELEHSPHPLIRDQAVVQAWGQTRFACASGVNGLLRAVSDESVDALKTQLRQVLAPYRRRVLRSLPSDLAVVDFDLTGLVVSDQAQTYAEADFGYMDAVGRVGKGYQFARAQLIGKHDVLVLGGFLHPGRTVSAHCLQELVALTEREIGRPRRRVAVVQARLEQTEAELATVEETLMKRTARRPEQPPPKRLAQRQERLAAQVAQLRARVEELEADNAANPNPRPILLRLDGGFGDAASITWLYEQGYSVVARVHSSRVAAKLRKEEGLAWEKVSKNGFIAEAACVRLGDCPYPLRLFACRQWMGEEKPDRWSALVVTPDLAAKTWPARQVGRFYNQRQTMEAGIKESKGVFASRHFPTRHQPGIALYEELVLGAQNLIRWFRRQVLAHTRLAHSGIKELVRVAANSRAIVVRQGTTILLTFTADGPWPGLTLPLRLGIAYQLSFPFFDDAAPIPAGP